MFGTAVGVCFVNLHLVRCPVTILNVRKELGSYTLFLEYCNLIEVGCPFLEVRTIFVDWVHGDSVLSFFIELDRERDIFDKVDALLRCDDLRVGSHHVLRCF